MHVQQLQQQLQYALQKAQLLNHGHVGRLLGELRQRQGEGLIGRRVDDSRPVLHERQHQLLHFAAIITARTEEREEVS